MIELENIHFSIAHKTLLENVSACIEDGKLTMILGPNGAGKSTLLKCCTGSLIPSKGQVILDNIPLSNWPIDKLARTRAVLTQQVTMPFALSVREVISLGLSPWKLDSQQANTLIQRLLSSVSLKQMEQRQYNTLSGGEQQRVQIVRVLLQLLAGDESLDGKYLLLDEPLSALDLQQQQNILRLLKSLTKEGLSIVCVIHDINLAVLYADKLLLMNAGRLVYQGTPTDEDLDHHIRLTYKADLIHCSHAKNQLPQWLLSP